MANIKERGGREERDRREEFGGGEGEFGGDEAESA